MSKINKKKIISELKYVYSDNNTLSIIFQNNELLLGVTGEFNNNLKELEKITETGLYSRGNSILVKSTPEKNNIVKNAIQFLTEQYLNNGTIEKKDIISSISKFMINQNNNSEKKNRIYYKDSKKICNSKIRKTEGLCQSIKRVRHNYFSWTSWNR